jgi:uncharacterized protein (DUF427 family)
MFSRPKPIQPQPGQESVWDYPRPPRLEPCQKKIEIICQGITLANTEKSYRVLETSHPPVYYLPPEDIKMEYLQKMTQTSFCEWKGRAGYYAVKIGDQIIPNAAWFYPEPTPGFLPMKNYIAFYAHLMDGCYVDGEKATPQPGNFYGGWITSDLVGPFKGEPGSWGW